MAIRGKKYKAAREKVDKSLVLSFKDGVTKVKDLAFAKFDESVDAQVNVGIDPTKGDQVVRGSVLLPFKTGPDARVIVFAKGDYAIEAQKAGADYVGAEDLVEKILAGWTDFDYAVATPDLMAMVSRLAKLLGPRGLLPNKKVGTVTFDVASTVTDLKKGRKFFKNDKNGIIHFSFGKVSLGVDKLQQNLVAFLKALASSKPSSSKGKFLKKVTIASTMGVGVPVSPDEVFKV